MKAHAGVTHITIQYLTGFEHGNITVMEGDGQGKTYALNEEQMALVWKIKEEVENGTQGRNG